MTQEARAGFSQIVWPVPWFAFNWVRTKFNFSFQYRPLVDQFQAFNRVTHGVTSPQPLFPFSGEQRESVLHRGCPNKQTSMLNSHPIVIVLLDDIMLPQSQRSDLSLKRKQKLLIIWKHSRRLQWLCKCLRTLTIWERMQVLSRVGLLALISDWELAALGQAGRQARGRLPNIKVGAKKHNQAPRQVKSSSLGAGDH